MKKLIISTATGAVVGAVLYKIAPCHCNRNTNKFRKKGKKFKNKIMKKVSCIIKDII